MIKKGKLLRSEEPYSDESLMGYIIRLTEKNDYDTTSWILQMSGIQSYMHGKVGFTYNKELNLGPLATLSGVEESKLASLIYQPTEPSRRFSNLQIFGSEVPKYILRPQMFKVCPGCLQDSIYIRQIWELIPVTACPIHDCLLLDECPGCLRRLPVNRRAVSQCQCRCDWRDAQLKAVEESELTVSKQIHNLCNLLPKATATVEKSACNPLYVLQLSDLLSALFFIASQYKAITYKNGKRHLDTKGMCFSSTMRNTEIHTLLYKSFTTFENWPVNYFSFFDWRREQEQASEKHYRGLRKDFNEYKHALYRQLDSPHLNFMREGFEEYLSTRWHGGYISGIKRMSDTTRQNKKYVSFNEAVKLLNVGRDGLKRLIDEGRLDALVRPAGKTSMTLLELCHVNQLKAELDQLLSRTQAKDLLGISFERTPELVDCNLLRLRHHPTDLSNPLRYCRQEIEELLAHTKSKVLNKASLKQHKMMALTTVLRLLPDCEAGLGQFIKAICEGKMNPCRMNIKRGLGGLYFHDIDVMNYVRELIRKRIGNVVRVDEAAKSLGVQKQFVYLLIKSGLLITRKLLVNGRMNQFITTRSINIFSSTYVLPCMLAQGVHINANKIAKMLAGQGIYPIAAPLGGDHRYTIFRKSDLDGVDIKSLIKNKKPQQYYRMGDRLVDLDQASILLGISKEAIQEYVRNGVLSPCNQLSHSHFMKGSLCFSKYTIDAFKTQAPNYVGLVSANVAAAMLGKHIRNFNIKYVRTCRLSPVYIDGKPGKRFFRIKDIEAMIELEKATIGSGSVAGILKVSMSSIYRMVLSGELKPISGPHVDGYPVNLYLRVDVEKLKTARDAFRSECVRVGKMTRYSKPSDNRSCPVQEKIIPRVKQWLKDQFSRNGMTQRICGLELQRLLLSEGYKIATTTIYKVLRKQLEQHSMAQGGV